MTDYLEERLGNARFLLEQVKRLEKGGNGPADETPQKEIQRDLTQWREEYAAPQRAGREVFQGRETLSNLNRLVDRIGRPVDGPGSGSLPQGERGEKNVNAEAGVEYGPWPDPGASDEAEKTGSRAERGRSDVEKGREHRNTLAERLEKLDRAVSLLSAADLKGAEKGGQLHTAFPEVPLQRMVLPAPEGGGRWEGRRGGSAGCPSALEGTLDWVELADQVFRRDSRRYDGGFYLY